MDKIVISEDRYGRKLNHMEDDDIIDRLNNRYTVMALIMCFFIITGKTYIGEPINSQFTGPHNVYTNSICWLKGSYYLPTEEITIPDRSKPRLYHVSYYQWTPFILLGMALFFLLPRYIWLAFTRGGGVNIQRIVKTTKDQLDPDKGVVLAQRSLKSYIDTQNTLHGTMCCGIPCHHFYYSYTLTYFSIKILYIVNTLCQFFLLNTFLSFHFTSYGPQGINKLFTNDDWFESPRFPRVTMCDFMIRHLGSNQHWYAIQCNLPINIYNEKIFLGIWIWLIVLTILNFLSMIFWMVSLAKTRRVATIKKYLKIYTPRSEEKEALLSSTTMIKYRRSDVAETADDLTHYLGLDGFLIFDIIARNTDDIVAGKIIDLLSKTYERPARHHMSNV
ncbi:unnamed protein product [Rotaria sordida]|uniref:Innexin n=1 Tax=Rotaria sordida TaxID=392033 RepID=A0A815HHL8_9BILA|nr:unnamed protein product [Rotaria sordida]